MTTELSVGRFGLCLSQFMSLSSCSMESLFSNFSLRWFFGPAVDNELLAFECGRVARSAVHIFVFLRLKSSVCPFVVESFL